MARAVLDEVACFLVPRQTVIEHFIVDGKPKQTRRREITPKGMLCFARDKKGNIRFRKVNDKFCFRDIKEMEQGEDRGEVFTHLVGEPITFLAGWGCHGFDEEAKEFSKDDRWQAKSINIRHAKLFPLVGEVI